MQPLQLFLLSILLLMGGTVHALPLFQAYTNGHVDLSIRYQNDRLELFFQGDGQRVEGRDLGDNEGDFDTFGLRVLGVFDDAIPTLIRPVSNAWNPIGVAAGQPFFQLPSSGNPLLPFFGWSAEDPSLDILDDLYLVDEYRIRLIEVQGPAGAVFSVYEFSGGPIFRISNFNATGPTGDFGYIDVFPGEHLHYFVNFTQTGTYDLTFQLEALDAFGVIPELTGDTMVRLQITEGGGYDNYNHWRRTRFPPATMNDDLVSAPFVDPLGDGRVNLERYAFGERAVKQFLRVNHGGESYPAVRLTVREDAPDLDWFVEHSSSLEPGSWSSDGLVLHSREPIFHNPGLAILTYRLDTAEPRLFFRSRAALK